MLAITRNLFISFFVLSLIACNGGGKSDSALKGPSPVVGDWHFYYPDTQCEESWYFFEDGTFEANAYYQIASGTYQLKKKNGQRYELTLYFESDSGAMLGCEPRDSNLTGYYSYINIEFNSNQNEMYFLDYDNKNNVLLTMERFDGTPNSQRSNPVVTSSWPSPDSQFVHHDLQKIRVSFNKEMDASSFNSNNVILKNTVTDEKVEIDNIYFTKDNSNTVLIDLGENSSNYNAEFELIIKKDVKDIEGDQLRLDFVINFSMETELEPPEVIYETFDPDFGFSSDVSNKSTLIIEFSEPINAETLTNENITLVTDYGSPVDFDLIIIEPHIIEIDPLVSDTFDEEVVFKIENIEDLNGNSIENPYLRFFELNDYTPPGIISISPEFTNVLTNTVSFTIEFSENIYYNYDSNPLSLVIDEPGKNLVYSPVQTNQEINNNILTITPLEPLKYTGEYRLLLDKNDFSDFEGNSPYDSEHNYFKVSNHPDSISIQNSSGALSTNTNSYFDYVNNGGEANLRKTDLSSLSREYYQFDQNIEDICIDDADGLIYTNEPYSNYFSELKASNLELIRTVSTTTVFKLDEYSYFDKYVCEENSITLHSSPFQPGENIYSISKEPPHSVTEYNGIENAASYNFISDNSVFTVRAEEITTRQEYNIYLSRYEKSESSEWEIIDESKPANYSSYEPSYPWSMIEPIFFDEVNDRVINGKKVYNANNLKQEIHTFRGQNPIILAVDFNRNRIVTGDGVYSLDDYKLIQSLPFAYISRAEFNETGDLYLFYSEYRRALIKIPEEEIGQ